MLHDRDQQQLEKVAEQVLDFAKQEGASSAEVAVQIALGFSVNVRNSQIDTVEHNHDKGVSITVYRGQASGSASTTDMNADSLRQVVQAAINIAKYTQEDPCNGLADKMLMAMEFPDLDIYHPWGLTTEQAIEKLIECETIARKYDKRITNSDGVSLSTHEGLDVYANSHGFIGRHKNTRHNISCVLIAEQGDEMQRDYEYTVSCDPQRLTNLKAIATDAAKKTLERLGSRSISTQRVPVLFRADVARGLLNHFISAIRGGALYRKATFLLDHLGKPIFPSWFSLEEQPYLKNSLSSSAFDDEGVQTYQKYFIEQGILKSYCLDSYTARKLKLETTANAGGTHNLIVSHSDIELKALLKQMNTGLLVTEVMGQGVNITTGDYSRGASGFWVENGEIQFPVSEITIAGNLKDIFANIAAIANDVDTRGNIRTGSILVEQMMVAGN